MTGNVFDYEMVTNKEYEQNHNKPYRYDYNKYGIIGNLFNFPLISKVKDKNIHTTRL